MMLGDFGAEVIKIENPNGGDDTRAFGPPFLEGESAYFLSINRNKKSVTLNLKDERAKKIIRELIPKCDVFLENFRPGTCEKLGFSYAEVARINPKMIYCSISGFGQTGPEKFRPGYDLVVQGMGGIMDLTGDPGGPPYKVGVSQADLLSGIYAIQGILLALYAREKTGKGQYVDVAMFDGQISLLTFQAGIYFTTGRTPKRKGNQHPTICPYETFKASDGYINIAVGNDKLWSVFCKLLNKLNPADFPAGTETNPKFATNPERVKNRDELFGIIGGIIGKKDTGYWLKLFDESGIPAGPILTVDKVVAHPQAQAREMIIEMQHPKAGKIKLTGIPVKLSATPGEPQSPPPLLGQHTEEVLKNLLNYDEKTIERLRRENVI
jgi:crotonobetainyl-CoA:carnitine CoA-transferase CaiB-like acyl-CoA transferase